MWSQVRILPAASVRAPRRAAGERGPLSPALAACWGGGRVQARAGPPGAAIRGAPRTLAPPRRVRPRAQKPAYGLQRRRSGASAPASPVRLREKLARWPQSRRSAARAPGLERSRKPAPRRDPRRRSRPGPARRCRGAPSPTDLRCAARRAPVAAARRGAARRAPVAVALRGAARRGPVAVALRGAARRALCRGSASCAPRAGRPSRRAARRARAGRLPAALLRVRPRRASRRCAPSPTRECRAPWWRCRRPVSRRARPPRAPPAGPRGARPPRRSPPRRRRRGSRPPSDPARRRCRTLQTPRRPRSRRRAAAAPADASASAAGGRGRERRELPAAPRSWRNRRHARTSAGAPEGGPRSTRPSPSDRARRTSAPSVLPSFLWPRAGSCAPGRSNCLTALGRAFERPRRSRGG